VAPTLAITRRPVASVVIDVRSRIDRYPTST
jgi:hypothetical protein